MGYLNVESAATFVLGVPAAMQTTFMIEGAMNRVLQTPQAVVMFRQFLARCEEVENYVFCNFDLSDVESIGTGEAVKINRKRLKELAEHYLIAQESLANFLGIVPNPFDQRGWLMKGRGGVNVPVSG